MQYFVFQTSGKLLADKKNLGLETFLESDQH